MSDRRKLGIFGAVSFLVGLTVGGYLFSDVRPRSFLAINRCNHCLHPNELVGLIASVGIKKAPSLMPSVVLETEKTIAIRHPAPSAKQHFVIIPKKDIKNVGELSDVDQDALIDIFSVATKLIRGYKLERYRLWSNGPDNQIVAYLHFHLAGS